MIPQNILNYNFMIQSLFPTVSDNSSAANGSSVQPLFPNEPSTYAGFTSFNKDSSIPVATDPNAKIKTAFPVVKAVVGAVKDYSNNLLKATSQPIADAAKKVATDYHAATSLGDAAKTGLNIAGDITGGVVGEAGGAIQAGIVKPVSDAIASSPVLQKVASSKLSGIPQTLDKSQQTQDFLTKKYNDFAQAHPQAAKTIEDAGNIGQFMTIFLGDDPELQSKVSQGVQTTIEGAKSVGDHLAGVKDDIAGNIDEIKAAQADKSAQKESNTVMSKIKPDPETMTPTMKKEAIDAGLQKTVKTPLGSEKITYGPTPEVQRANELLQDKDILGNNTAKASDSPGTVYAKTKAAISILGKGAEDYLAQNPIKITNNEDLNLFKDMRDKMAKYSTDTELNAYDEQVKLFNRQLKGRPGGYTTENYYKALKEYEDNVGSKLARGKEALLDPTGVASAKINAAADIRKGVRDLIGMKHPEFKPKMYDLASLYEAKDNALFNASKAKSKNIFQRFPTATAIIGGGVADKVSKHVTGLGF